MKATLETKRATKLIDDANTFSERQEILEHIFGENSLINADNAICYQVMSEQRERDLTLISTKFLKYFTDRLQPAIRTKANQPERYDLIDDNWTNNNCESINHVLKQLMDWKSQSLTTLMSLIHSHAFRYSRRFNWKWRI